MLLIPMERESTHCQHSQSASVHQPCSVAGADIEKTDRRREPWPGPSKGVIWRDRSLSDGLWQLSRLHDQKKTWDQDS